MADTLRSSRPLIVRIGVKCLSSWSSLLATGSYDATVKVHDSTTWETLATLQLHSQVFVYSNSS